MNEWIGLPIFSNNGGVNKDLINKHKDSFDSGQKNHLANYKIEYKKYS
jgi:hypothetical protein